MHDAPEQHPQTDRDTPDAKLQLTRGTQPLFSSYGSWLYPLMELEQFLLDTGEDVAGCRLFDKVVGRAGALLIVRLGIRSVKTEVLSERAVPVFEEHHVTYVAGETVSQIGCMTEQLLAEVDDPDTAYERILERMQSSATTPEHT